MTHTSENYGDVGNFSGVTYVMLPFMNLKFVGTWAPTAKITGDIPDFSVLNVPKTQPQHNLLFNCYDTVFQGKNSWKRSKRKRYLAWLINSF